MKNILNEILIGSKWRGSSLVRLLSLGFLSIITLPVFGSEVAVTLMPPSDPVVAGRSAHVDIVAMNPGAREAAFDVDSQLPGALRIGANSWPVTLQASGIFSSAVAPGSFVVRHFLFEVPPSAVGRAILEVPRRDGSFLRAVVDVTADAPTAGTVESPSTPLDRVISNASASSVLTRNFVGRFQPNLPTYFIYGNGAAQAAKFQFSFDYRLATMVFGPTDTETVANLRLGYTQRSLWDTSGPSSPFYDTSYMPELVLTTDAPMPRNRDQFFTWLGIRTGFQHESNGKDGTDSRSMNTYYIRPRFALGSLNSWTLVMLPEIYDYIGGLSDNKDLKSYRGYGKLRFYLGRNDGPTLMFTGWTGKEFDHGTYQLDLTIPAHVRWLNIESYIQAQYFRGYGETLRDYDKRSDAFRVGLALVR